VGAVLASRIRLKVAFVTELYPPSIGGQQTRFENLALGLTALGDAVTVFCIDSEEPSRAFEVRSGVTVIRAPRIPHYERAGALGIDRSVAGMLRFGARVRRELKRREFDAIYFNQWPYLHIALATRQVRAIGGIDWCEVRGGAIHGFFQRVLPRSVAFNVSVNEWVAEQIGASSGQHVQYLPSGVATQQYWGAPAAERRGVLFLGRFVPNKNLPLLIEAYRELRRMGSSEPLRIAGDGPERAKVIAAIDRLAPELRKDVTLYGTVDDVRKRELLATSRVLAVPSLREGFPNVVSEAAAAGLPVATTTSPDNGTSRVVVKYGIGTTGSATPGGLADALSRALGQFEELSARCTAAAAGLDWPILARQLHEMLEKECAVRGAGRAEP
jgi:glycosyltransferase involved in cell wall biosynthesis